MIDTHYIAVHSAMKFRNIVTYDYIYECVLIKMGSIVAMSMPSKVLRILHLAPQEGCD